MIIVRYNEAGVKQWTRLLGAAGADTAANGISTDLSGNVYPTGYTSGNLDGNVITGIEDMFISKFDSAGNKVWTGF